MNLNDQTKRKRLSWYDLGKGFFVWLTQKKYAVFTLIIFSILLITFSYLPYINLFVDKILIAFLLITAALIIFKVSVKKIAIYILVLPLFSIPLVLLKRYETAEILTNFAYGFLFLAVAKTFWDE